MKYLIITLITLAITSCNQYNNCCEQYDCQCKPHNDICSTEKTETTQLTQEEITATIKQIANNFETKIKETLGVTPQLTTTTIPPTGVSSIISTTKKLDIKSARQMIIESAETLLEVANNNAYIKENAVKYPLTANDLDIFIDTNDAEATISSVSLIRGIIEYEALDTETKTHKIVKQEPLTHAQAKAESKNCCGAYFVSQK